MEIRPILSAMLHNKTGAVLVALQTAITLAVVVNAVFIVQNRLALVNRPNGMDVDNIIVLQSLGFAADYAHQATIREDLATLRAMPGVIAATPTQGVPLSNSGGANGYTTTPEDDAEAQTANNYWVDEQAVAAFGVHLSDGRNFTAEEILYTEPGGFARTAEQVIITRAYADKLFGDDAEAIGKRIYDHTGKGMEIIGLIELMHGAWVDWDGLEQVMLIPIVRDGPMTRYIVRVSPGMVDTLLPEIEATLSALNPGRMIRRVQPMAEIVARSYARDTSMATVLLIVIGLLVVVTAAGIVGLASFTVKQRTKQIGTRRAVGARRRDILTYFMTENWLMMTMGVILGAALTLLLNYHLAKEYSLERLDPVYLPLGILAIWVLGLLAVFGPARRASMISPAIATRTV